MAISPKQVSDEYWRELCSQVYDKVYNTVNFGKDRDANAAWFAA